MGLDAAVYKARERFPVDPQGLGLRMEPVTHEWYSDDGKLPDVIKRVGTEAIHRRLGNISLIGSLHDEASRLMKPGSLIVSQVLYNGYHAGDVIGSERMQELKEELAALKCKTPLSLQFASFLDDLDKLVAVAVEQQNPIVFV
jgi:hypothetical protein